MITTSVYSVSIFVNNTLTNNTAGFPTTRLPVFKHVGRYFLSADKNRRTKVGRSFYDTRSIFIAR